jgi:hypothetical protein
MPPDPAPTRCRLAAAEVVLGLNARHSRTSEISAMRARITPFARARWNDAAKISSYLNNGAMGRFVPHVNTPEEAARAARYPPRSVMAAPAPRACFVKTCPDSLRIEKLNQLLKSRERPRLIKNCSGAPIRPRMD